MDQYGMKDIEKHLVSVVARQKEQDISRPTKPSFLKDFFEDPEKPIPERAFIKLAKEWHVLMQHCQADFHKFTQLFRKGHAQITLDDLINVLRHDLNALAKCVSCFV